MYLLDTNVVSETRKIRPGKANPGLAAWVAGTEAGELYLSVVTLQELTIGVLRMERRDPVQGSALRKWLEEQVLPGFVGRILAVDQRVAVHSAQLQVPDPRPVADCFIAATAKVHNLILVTRNTVDFQGTGAQLFNPWTP